MKRTFNPILIAALAGMAFQPDYRPRTLLKYPLDIPVDRGEKVAKAKAKRERKALKRIKEAR